MRFNPTAVVLLWVALCGLPAAERFVSPTGDDGTGNGSQASPYATLAKAYSLTAAGDVITLRGGTYTWNHGAFGSYLLVNKTASGGSPITVQAMSGETPIIDGSASYGPNASAGAFDGEDILFISGASWHTFRGLTFRNAKRNAVNAYGTPISTNLTFDACTFDGAFAGQIYTDGKLRSTLFVDCSFTNGAQMNQLYPNSSWPCALDLTGQDNVARRCHVYENHGEGIGCYGLRTIVEDCNLHDNFSVDIYVNTTQDCVVRRNRIWSAGRSAYYRTLNGIAAAAIGIEVANETSDPANLVNNATIIDNLVTGSRRHAFFWWTGFQTAGLTGSLIAHNTLAVTPAVSVLHLDDGAHTGTVFTGNSIVRMGSSGVLADNTTSTGLSVHHNHWQGGTVPAWAVGSGDRSGDPLFATPSGSAFADFMPGSGSPLLDVLTALPQVPIDALGTARPQGAAADLGCLERPANAAPLVTTGPLAVPTAMVLPLSPAIRSWGRRSSGSKVPHWLPSPLRLDGARHERPVPGDGVRTGWARLRGIGSN